MPGVHKQILDNNGRDLFNRTSRHSNSSTSRRWTESSSSKIRGVNIGSLFVFEPWLAGTEWKSIGCKGYKSEFDCVSALGQDAANTAFQKHWSTWYTEDDFTEMVSYGLNTIRIPVGYWMYESLVDSSSEYFPQGGFAYLEQVCNWAANAGLYIIIDLHGAPGAQVSTNADTGQYASTAGFYQTYQYTRAVEFLTWMTTNIHSNNNFRNVGTLEIVNEPIQNSKTVSTMLSSYYPLAFAAIRATELGLGISTSSSSSQLNIMVMSQKWGSGNPTKYLSSNYTSTDISYDDHRYLKWDSTVVPVSQSSYISASCSDNRGNASDTAPVIVGEFSLSVADSVENTSDWKPSNNPTFYKNWFAAQVMAYEKSNGWIMWAWKNQLGDLRWGYQAAVQAGVIPKNLDHVYDMNVC
ncbi:hypothetical protein UCRPC4_g06275 [Phaeomoniella chlamydospora]|uniref:glucan endo-1,6-beta-glucosidase n=1 Tax=Phaeomoniella chlamydospora TaxID=158046 RepID=A0A0G2FUJ5_PHACM|nr:hypothetical protein UCRPC4_g06275 [Phaeomoniella chlamydospora]